MVTSILIFAGGVILVIKGGDWFVDAATYIAKTLKIPSFIIGATLVSVATTLPELLVSSIAALNHLQDIAVGNALGSIIVNCGVILAITLIFTRVSIHRKDYLFQITSLVLAIFILEIGSHTGILLDWARYGLFGLFFLFFCFNIYIAANTNNHQDASSLDFKQLFFQLITFSFGIIAIVLGSQLLIQAGTEIANYLNVPERIIAVTLMAIGTSLPELVTTLSALIKKETQLSIGNIIGASILNLTLVIPISATLSSQHLHISQETLQLDVPFCLLVVTIATFPLILFKKSFKIQGFALLLVYSVYLLLTL